MQPTRYPRALRTPRTPRTPRTLRTLYAPSACLPGAGLSLLLSTLL